MDMRLFLHIILWISCWVSATAQRTFTLSGTISDDLHEPIPMATVAVEHTTLGTYSDERGHYAIRLKEGTYTLVVSSGGFESVRWKV